MELLLGEASAPAAPATTSPSGKLPWMVAAGLAVAIAALTFFALPHFHEKPPAMVKFLIPSPEKYALNEASGPPAVSPDGRRVAFRADAIISAPTRS